MIAGGILALAGSLPVTTFEESAGETTSHTHAQRQTHPEIITAAIEGYEAQKARLDSRIANLRQMLDGSRPVPQ